MDPTDPPMPDDDDDHLPPPIVTQAPEWIWLNVGEIEFTCEFSELTRNGDVTWCDLKQFDADIAYVRADRLAALEADLAKVKDYATTLATSMHRQHYAEAAPNWQPLDDLMGLLTQIDNMYAGLRNDFADLEVENKRLVGMNLAGIKAERDAAVAALEMIYDKYEGGAQCFDDADAEFGSYMGNAVHLDKEEEDQILACIPPYPAARKEEP